MTDHDDDAAAFVPPVLSARRPSEASGRERATRKRTPRVAARQGRRAAGRAVFGSVARIEGSGRWRATYREGGKRRSPERGKSYATEAEAWEALAAFKAARDAEVARLATAPDEDDRSPEAAPTLAEWTAEWMEVQRLHLAPTTQQVYASTIKTSVLRGGDASLADMQVSRITPMKVRRWVSSLAQPWTPPGEKPRKTEGRQGASSRKKALLLLGQILRAAKEEGWAVTDPTQGVVAARRGEEAAERREHFYFQGVEVARMVEEARKRPEDATPWGGLALFLEVAAWTGSRPGELRALAPRALRPAAGMIEISRAMSRMTLTTPKNGQRRLAVIPGPVMEALQERVETLGLGPDEPIWQQRTGGPRSPGFYYDTFATVAAAAGIRRESAPHRTSTPTFYDLRAFLVSHLLGAGLPLVEVQAQVGHRLGTDVTDLYTQVQVAGQEDPAVVAARSAGIPMTRSAVVDWLYARIQEDAQAARVTPEVSEA